MKVIVNVLLWVPTTWLLDVIVADVIVAGVNPLKAVVEYWAIVLPFTSTNDVIIPFIAHVDEGLLKFPTLTENDVVEVPVTDSLIAT